jgi:hypothetical protein
MHQYIWKKFTIRLNLFRIPDQQFIPEIPDQQF